MKLKNHELEPFIIFLQKLILSGKPSRMRTRFKNLLLEKYQLFQKEKEEIAIKYAQKDENDQPKTKEENGQKIYLIDDVKTCEKEMNELFLEDAVIDETGERIEMLKSVKITVLDYDEPSSGQDSDNWNRFCEIVEQLNFD